MSITVQSNNPEADALVNNATKAEPEEKKEEQITSAPEAKAPEQKEESEDSGTKETEEEKEGEAANAKESEFKDADNEDEAEKDEKPKKRGGFQRRIDKLTQEREFWRAEALKRASAPTATDPAVPKVDPKPAAAEGKPKPDQFDSHEQYVEALTDWKTEQKLNEFSQKLQKEKLEAEQAKLNRTFSERLESFKQKTPDFDETIQALDDVRSSPTVEQIIRSSKDGPEILYALAKDHNEAARISKLPPIEAAMAIGQIRAKITTPSSEAKPETKKLSSAPKPISAISGAGKASAGPKTLEEAAKTSFSDFKRLREEELKQKRRRA